eukprot:COSAG01_NODE_3477_length_6027_cov_53.431849_2_plen_123_part_00
MEERDKILAEVRAKLAAAKIQNTELDSQLRSMRGHMQSIDNERCKLAEELEGYIEKNRNLEVDELVNEVKFFENGRYSDSIRVIYYTKLKIGRCAKSAYRQTLPSTQSFPGSISSTAVSYSV